MNEMHLMVKKEAIWILTNMTFETGNCHDLTNRGVPQHMINLLQLHFLSQDSRSLLDLELELLVDLLWFTANSATEEPIAIIYSDEMLEQILFQITMKYHTQFKSKHWRLIMWNLRMMARSLPVVQSQDTKSYI